MQLWDYNLRNKPRTDKTRLLLQSHVFTIDTARQNSNQKIGVYFSAHFRYPNMTDGRYQS